jgi:PAS domain S-box-containing protein
MDILGNGRVTLIRKQRGAKTIGPVELQEAREALKSKAHDLEERVKELHCLYHLSEILAGAGMPLEQDLQEIVDLIPLGWQEPAIACARLLVGEKAWLTANFRDTPWQLSRDLTVGNRVVGRLTVGYLEERPEHVVRPDLPEKASLLKAIAERLGAVIEHQELEQVRQQSEKKFNLFYEKAPLGYQSLDEDGRIIEVNQSWLDYLGFSRENVIGRWFGDFLTDDAADLFPARFAGFKGKSEVDNQEFEMVRQDGSHLFVSFHGRVEWDQRGQFIRSHCVFQDITARRRAERDLAQSHAKLQKILHGTIAALATVVETRDPYTAGHHRRVAQLAQALARELGLSRDEQEGMGVLGFLHDIGKVCVPAEILSKPSRLSEYEFSLIKVHPQVGYDILKEVEFPWPVAQAVLQHHERLDGSGYPAGLTDSHIIREARVLMVADVVEAMASHRPYRASLGLDCALDEIASQRGVLYDPEVVDACVGLFADRRFTFD